MGVLIEDRILESIDAAKERIDKRRIEDYIKLMHRNLISEVINTASVIDEDNFARKKFVIQNFKKAWDHTASTFSGDLDLLTLQNIAGKIEPEMCNPGKDYSLLRNGYVRLEINGKEYTPPVDRARINLALERMFGAANSHVTLHPVEEAIFYNLHITRIQPFDNANKRTSNMVMNSILLKEGYFPIHLRPQDIKAFRFLSGNAILGFREQSAEHNPESILPFLHPEKKQRDFYEFMGNRELFELGLAEDRLKGLHHYKVIFRGIKDRSTMFSAKKTLQNWFNSHGMLHQERLQTGDRCMDVYGEIPRETLRGILSKVKPLGYYEIIDNGRH